MPNMNGIDATRKLRSMYGNSVKIYILTGDVTLMNDSSIQNITDGVLTKPSSKNDIERCLEILR